MAKTINSVMAGTIFRMEVAVGDSFDFGDTIAILESMKMEIPIEADGAGTVEALLVEEGQTVDSGVPLISYK